LIRHQIVIGTAIDEIREEALKQAWDFKKLRKEGMRLKSAAKGASEISGNMKINKVWKYSRKNQKKRDNWQATMPRCARVKSQ